MRQSTAIPVLVGLCVISGHVEAQVQSEQQSQTSARGAANAAPPINILYPKDFEAYAPVTARDALERLPGLEIVDPDDIRGLGSGGNVLINGERSGGKSNTALDQLDRLSAGAIERVEIYAAATASFDAGGSSQVINVVIDVSDGTISGTYGGNMEISVMTGDFYGDANVSGTWTKNKLTVDLAFASNGDKTPSRGQETLGPVGSVSSIFRDETRLSVFRDYQVNAALAYKFAPRDVLRISAQGTIGDRDTFERTTDVRVLNDLAAQDTLLDIADDDVSFEGTVEYERAVGQDLQLKFTALQSIATSEDTRSFRDLARTDPVSLLGLDNDTQESILRGRAVWQASSAHQFTFQLEGAYNKLVAQLFSQQIQPGPLIDDFRSDESLVSNTIVQEYRGDLSLIDQWSIGKKFVLTTALAGEISNLQVSGSQDNSRVLKFPKPSVELAYQIRPKHRLELSIERIIGQLDFLDFAANVSLADADQRGSTGALRPEREWRSNVTWEWQLPRRSGRSAVTLYHNLVQDPIEPVPISAALDETIDTIGNIGSANRFGVTAEFSLRLGQWNLPDILLEGNITAQRTRVEDPITGENRRLRDERPLTYSLSYRHDITKWKVSYGAEMSFNGETRAFEINQAISERRTLSGQAFIETQAIKGMTLQLRVINMFDRRETRDRTIFDPNRIRSINPFLEARERRIGRYVRFALDSVF
ncbi:MAG: TonB-dependent receptor [Pseudomonadota bacterium]